MREAAGPDRGEGDYPRSGLDDFQTVAFQHQPGPATAELGQGSIQQQSLGLSRLPKEAWIFFNNSLPACCLRASGSSEELVVPGLGGVVEESHLVREGDVCFMISSRGSGRGLLLEVNSWSCQHTPDSAYRSEIRRFFCDINWFQGLLIVREGVRLKVDDAPPGEHPLSPKVPVATIKVSQQRPPKCPASQTMTVCSLPAHRVFLPVNGLLSCLHTPKEHLRTLPIMDYRRLLSIRNGS